MKLIILLNFILLTLFSCNSERGIKNEIQTNILSHKKFIKESSFEGKIDDKIYCEECNFNKYQIKIKINKMQPDNIGIGNLSFQPYYVIASKNEISLSVNKEMYEAAEKGTEVTKKPNANSLYLNNKEYKLLSEEKYKWIPK